MKPLYINQKSRSLLINRQCELWDIDKLESELNAKKLPESLRLSNFEMIDNMSKYIVKQISIVRNNNGNLTFQPYWERLQKVNEMFK